MQALTVGANNFYEQCSKFVTSTSSNLHDQTIGRFKNLITSLPSATYTSLSEYLSGALSFHHMLIKKDLEPADSQEQKLRSKLKILIDNPRHIQTIQEAKELCEQVGIQFNDKQIYTKEFFLEKLLVLEQKMIRQAKDAFEPAFDFPGDTELPQHFLALFAKKVAKLLPDLGSEEFYSIPAFHQGKRNTSTQDDQWAQHQLSKRELGTKILTHWVLLNEQFGQSTEEISKKRVVPIYQSIVDQLSNQADIQPLQTQELCTLGNYLKKQPLPPGPTFFTSPRYELIELIKLGLYGLNSEPLQVFNDKVCNILKACVDQDENLTAQFSNCTDVQSVCTIALAKYDAFLSKKFPEDIDYLAEQFYECATEESSIEPEDLDFKEIEQKTELYEALILSNELKAVTQYWTIDQDNTGNTREFLTVKLLKFKHHIELSKNIGINPICIPKLSFTIPETGLLRSKKKELEALQQSIPHDDDEFIYLNKNQATITAQNLSLIIDYLTHESLIAETNSKQSLIGDLSNAVNTNLAQLDPMPNDNAFETEMAQLQEKLAARVSLEILANIYSWNSEVKASALRQLNRSEGDLGQELNNIISSERGLGIKSAFFRYIISPFVHSSTQFVSSEINKVALELFAELRNTNKNRKAPISMITSFVERLEKSDENSIEVYARSIADEILSKRPFIQRLLYRIVSFVIPSLSLNAVVHEIATDIESMFDSTKYNLTIESALIQVLGELKSICQQKSAFNSATEGKMIGNEIEKMLEKLFDFAAQRKKKHIISTIAEKFDSHIPEAVFDLIDALVIPTAANILSGVYATLQDEQKAREYSSNLLKGLNANMFATGETSAIIDDPKDISYANQKAIKKNLSEVLDLIITGVTEDTIPNLVKNLTMVVEDMLNYLHHGLFEDLEKLHAIASIELNGSESDRQAAIEDKNSQIEHTIRDILFNLNKHLQQIDYTNEQLDCTSESELNPEKKYAYQAMLLLKPMLLDLSTDLAAVLNRSELPHRLDAINEINGKMQEYQLQYRSAALIKMRTEEPYDGLIRKAEKVLKHDKTVEIVKSQINHHYQNMIYAVTDAIFSSKAVKAGMGALAEKAIN